MTNKDRLLEKLRLKDAIVHDFNRLYVREYTTDWQTKRLIFELELRDLDMENTEKYLLNRESKIIKKVGNLIYDYLESYKDDTDAGTIKYLLNNTFLAQLKSGVMPKE